MEIPVVGPLVASAFVANVAEPAIFRSGRNLAAWIGLVPKQNSSDGKERLAGITKTGNRYLRQMLIVGALAVIRHAEHHAVGRPWLVQLLARRKPCAAPLRLSFLLFRRPQKLIHSASLFRLTFAPTANKAIAEP